MKFNVFINEDYVRDAQAYLGSFSDDCDNEIDIYDADVDHCWKDCSGDMRVMDVEAASEDEVWAKIKNFYPDADERVFLIENVPDSFYKQLVIPVADMERINHILNHEPKSSDDYFAGTISYTVDFGGGIEMDVKVCGVDFRENESNKPWTEAVLFNHGCEVAHTDPDESFAGIWMLEFDDIKYIVNLTSSHG